MFIVARRRSNILRHKPKRVSRANRLGLSAAGKFAAQEDSELKTNCFVESRESHFAPACRSPSMASQSGLESVRTTRERAWSADMFRHRCGEALLDIERQGLKSQPPRSSEIRQCIIPAPRSPNRPGKPEPCTASL